MARLNKFFVLVGLMLTQAISAPSDSGSRANITNLTDSPAHYEFNPSFAEQGRSVLFLMFNGDVDDPRPWDYVLCKSDILGHTWSYVSAAGVIDYRVQDDGYHVLILRTDPERTFEGSGLEFYSSRCNWEIRRLDLRTESELLVESAKNEPLTRGYARLGVDGLPDFELGRSISRSPDGQRNIIVRREKNRDRYFFNFSQIKEGSRRDIYSTEAWKSYRDEEWFPKVVWLQNNSFLTVTFRSDPNPKFPQSEGLFSIVKFNLNNDDSEVVYKAAALEPFTNLCYNPYTRDIFFQKMNANTNKIELCRLNSFDKDVEIVYESDWQLGELRFEPQGSEAVLTGFQNDNSDIFRLTLNGHRIQRLVNK